MSSDSNFPKTPEPLNFRSFCLIRKSTRCFVISRILELFLFSALSSSQDLRIDYVKMLNNHSNYLTNDILMMVSCCPLSVSIFGSQAYFYSYNLLPAASLLLYSQNLKWRNTIISLYLAFSILQLTTSLLIVNLGIERRKLFNLHKFKF